MKYFPQKYLYLYTVYVNVILQGLCMLNGTQLITSIGAEGLYREIANYEDEMSKLNASFHTDEQLRLSLVFTY